MQMLAIVILKPDRDYQVEKSDLQLCMTVWNGWRGWAGGVVRGGVRITSK